MGTRTVCSHRTAMQGTGMAQANVVQCLAQWHFNTWTGDRDGTPILQISHWATAAPFSAINLVGHVKYIYSLQCITVTATDILIACKLWRKSTIKIPARTWNGKRVKFVSTSAMTQQIWTLLTCESFRVGSTLFTP